MAVDLTVRRRPGDLDPPVRYVTMGRMALDDREVRQATAGRMSVRERLRRLLRGGG